jgi:peptide/nickel transport system permease protein
MFILKRLLLSVIVLLGLSVVIFCVARIIPGDPARLALGSTATQNALDIFRAENHLDQPLPVQYAYWIGGVLRGNFGTSTSTKRAVAQDVAEFLPATLEMACFSAVFLIVFSIAIGTLAANWRDSLIDGLVRIMSYIGIAIPGFVIATVLLLLFGYVWPVIPVLGRLSHGITPPPGITGFYTVDSLLSGNFRTFWDAFLHLLIPAVALCMGGLCQEARLVRNSMIENLSKDYLAAMKGYGAPRRVIAGKYLLKPSLIPAVSCMGMDIASLMSNAFLIEVIFGWPGISRYGMNAMLSKDLNVISSVILIFGAIFVGINILVDVAVAYLDPRIRLGGAV